MKRTFVRLVSHEIRTPLNTVKVGLELLDRKSRMGRISAEDCSDIIYDARQSCDAAIDILTDLLNYEKLDAGLLTLERTEFAALCFLTDSIMPFNLQVSRLYKCHTVYGF